MTIVKHETVELTREEYAIINKCIKLMGTIKKGAEDPVLIEDTKKVIYALDFFKRDFTIHENASDGMREMCEEMAGADVGVQVRADETMSDYDRGFQDGMKWEQDNPPIRPNY